MDAKAYLRISKIELIHQEELDGLVRELNEVKSKEGKNSDKARELKILVDNKKEVVKVCTQCKNALYC